MTSDRYQMPSGAELRFSENVIRTFMKYKQSKGKPEAGGILLGRVYIDGRVFVEKVTAPSKWDRAGRYFFDRSKVVAQRAVNATWRESDGHVIYLGEWHTHPEASPTPSLRDKIMIRNMRWQTQMEIDFLITVIVGLNDKWVGLETGTELVKLNREM